MSRKYGDEVDEEKYDLNTSKNICSNHIGDEYIKNEILEKGIKGKCDYCNKTRSKVVKLSEVLKLIIVGIEYLTEDPAESRYLDKEAEYGFDGNVFTFDEGLLRDLETRLGIKTNELFDDVYEHLNNPHLLYCYKDEFGSEGDFLKDNWERFKFIVKHKARFVFHDNSFSGDYYYQNPLYILEKIQELINENGMIVEISENTTLYRCRQHSKKNDIGGAKDLVSSPFEYAKNNGRMNPAGIPMFYCSEDKKLTIQEVVNNSDKNNPFYTIGEFNNKSSLKVVDLTKIPDLPSIFDEDNNKFIESILFLKSFVEDAIKPINESDSIIEYIPTQIVTEYIRYNQKLDVQGLIYPSSKNRNKNNIVLFFDNDECIKELSLIKFWTKKI